MSEPTPQVLAIIACDFDRTAIGTRSRLADTFAGTTVLHRVVHRLLAVEGIGELALLVPVDQLNQPALAALSDPRLKIVQLSPRPESIAARVRIGRAWNLLAWRGGAGQFTFFDEEYHPVAFAAACKGAFDGTGADHILIIHSHAVFLDTAMTASLVNHHLHKNHEMRISYTPAAPGLCGMMLRADIVNEMAEKQVLPWQLLGYDPKQPQFDTLIREACMQVDPAVSKIPNRFCVDTQRSWNICKELANANPTTSAELCTAAARVIAPGIQSPRLAYPFPRELEIELTAARTTSPPGATPETIRNNRGHLDPAHWLRWLERHTDLPAKGYDDLLLTLAGDGDPLLYPPGTLLEILRAAHAMKPLSICVQTDLASGDLTSLFSAIETGFVDVVSVTMYGHTRETYARVAGADLLDTVMVNMTRLAEVTRARGGIPLVIPRLLKVRETIPELEPFFDTWIERCGWAVIDGPTDRAGSIPFTAVVDMAPPRRKSCRRIWERMLIHADGRAAACDQDVHNKLSPGSIESSDIAQMWNNLQNLRNQHAAGNWNQIDPCKSCREWHRP